MSCINGVTSKSALVSRRLSVKLVASDAVQEAYYCRFT